MKVSRLLPAPTDLHAVFTKGERVVKSPDLDVEAKIRIPCSRQESKSSRPVGHCTLQRMEYWHLAVLWWVLFKDAVTFQGYIRMNRWWMFSKVIYECIDDECMHMEQRWNAIDRGKNRSTSETSVPVPLCSARWEAGDNCLSYARPVLWCLNSTPYV